MSDESQETHSVEHAQKQIDDLQAKLTYWKAVLRAAKRLEELKQQKQ